MKITELTKNNISLLIEMSKKNSITSREQKTYSPFAFYLNIGFLKDKGLVMENGIDNNLRKKWCLTEKGKALVEYIQRIEELL